MKKRPPIAYKVKVTLQKEIALVCPFCKNKEAEHFEIHHIDDSPENNDLSNLIMLCPTCHSKITKGDITRDEVVKKKLQISSVIHIEVEEEIKPLLEELKKLIDEHKYDEAESVYSKAKVISDATNHEYSIAKLKKQYARIVNEKYFNLEKKDEILLECLKVFEKYKKADDIAYTKESLAKTKAFLGDLSSAEIFANDFLEFTKIKSENDELARAYMIVGLVFMQKDDLLKANELMDEAIKYGIRLTLSDEEKDRDIGTETITFCYQNKSVIYKRLGKISEAKGFCLKALEGHRILKKKKEYAQLLFELTEIECFEGNFAQGKWKEYIEEAKNIFREMQDYSWLARCIDLVSRIAYMSGQKELSLQIFQEGYEEIKKTNDKKGIAHFLGQFVSYFIAQKKYEEAEKYLAELIEFAEVNDLQHSIAHAYKDLAEIAHKRGDIKKRNEHFDFLIRHYETQYAKEQSEARKAYILGKISFIYFQLNDLRSALEISHKIAKIYDEQNIIGEYAKTLLGINEINAKLGNQDKLFEVWQKIIDVVEGTAFYEFGAVAKINCGFYLMDLGEYERAQSYADDAYHLVEKYKLKQSHEVEQLLEELKQRKDLNSPPVRSYSYMINRIYEGINRKKDLLEPLVRHWYQKNQLDLFKYFHQRQGLRGFLISDNLEAISKSTESLSWLFTFFLVASTEPFEEGGLDMFFYPYDDYEAGDRMMFLHTPDNDEKSETKEPTLEEKLLIELNKPKNEGSHSSYLFAPVKEGDEIKIMAVGRGNGLPKLVYDFFRIHNADEIINGNHFILFLDRFARTDKFYEDIRISCEMNYIPVYLNEELSSKKVSVLSKIQTEIPFGNYANTKDTAAAKKVFNSLFQASNDTAKTVLNDFKFALDNLFATERRKIKISVSLVEFRDGLKKIVYPIIILHE
jgi:tetratricopeptide (TPR) repeat protein